MKQIAWVSLGTISLLLGVIGIVLPLFPTTPFLLVSAFAFAESSPRLHDWLMKHPTFGPIIINWQENGSIDKRSKKIALALIILSPVLSVLLKAPLWAIVAQVFVLSGVALFILTRPD